MKFRTRLYFLSTVAIVLTTCSVLFTGMFIINKIIYSLNKQVLSLEISNIVENINKSYNTLDEVGVLKLEHYRELVRKDIIRLITKYNLRGKGNITVLNAKGIPISGYNPGLKNKQLKKIFSTPEGFTEMTLGSGSRAKNVLCFFRSTKFKWKVLLFVSREQIFAERNVYFRAVAVTGTAVLLMVLIASYMYSNILSKQISEILSTVKKVASGELDSKITIRPFSEEHRELQEGINSMIDELHREAMERELSDEEIKKHHKIETLGILAGGIAHDFNNILTAIKGNLQLAQLYPMNNELKTCLRDSETATERAIDLTRQLLSFAKGGVPVKKTASVKEILKHSGSFVLRGTKSKCEYSIDPGLNPVNIDVSQISQVIDNIIINANQATPEGGIININAHNIQIKDDSLIPLPSGNYVEISISDQGEGISKENLSKVFDPFFTTKKTGTGLGLSTSYSILKKHGGFITAESEIGEGTVFYIYLPASEKNIPPSDTKREVYFSGGARVLVMDDQESIRKLLGKMLSVLNCECGFAENGGQAVELYLREAKNGRAFDVVLLDLTIPGGMGGKATLESLKAIDPEVRAVIASGYSNDPVMIDYHKFGFHARLNKPFRINDLKRTLKKVISSGGLRNEFSSLETSANN